MDLAVVLDEPQLSEFVHEQIDPGPRCANHLRQHLLRYFGKHHKASDTIDSVVDKDLTQGAAVTAVTAYAIADSREPFAAHLSSAEVQSMLQKSGNLDAYNFLKKSGTLP